MSRTRRPQDLPTFELGAFTVRRTAYRAKNQVVEGLRPLAPPYHDHHVEPGIEVEPSAHSVPIW